MGTTMGAGNVADDDAESLVFADESEPDDDDYHCEQCNSLEDDVDCVHCECCCTCLGCEYGPRDGMLLNA